MRLRVARHTERLDELVAFYRDRLGLPEIGGFRDHDGYDGVFLDVPGTGAHLELTAGGEHGAPVPHPESLLVLSLGDDETVAEVAGRLGAEPVAPANPYWAEHGLTFADPDGFRVVLVPERREVAPRIEWFEGPREALDELLALADDSSAAVSGYRDRGRVLVAHDGDTLAGQLLLLDAERPGAPEVKSLAVREDRQGAGIGRALMERAAQVCREEGLTTLLLATAAADTHVIRFYQRLGYRLLRVERDVFTPATGYPDGIQIDGIPLRDQVWLSLEL